ncbi:MAG: hypothetical protein LBP62_03320 [Clostridiales bacterium]|jgi:hypothetical protein|nr:hypothetical protein [Clostridiales bacterium]
MDMERDLRDLKRCSGRYGKGGDKVAPPLDPLPRRGIERGHGRESKKKYSGDMKRKSGELKRCARDMKMECGY